MSRCKGTIFDNELLPKVWVNGLSRRSVGNEAQDGQVKAGRQKLTYSSSTTAPVPDPNYSAAESEDGLCIFTEKMSEQQETFVDIVIQRLDGMEQT